MKKRFQKIGGLFLPGDKGYDPEAYKRSHWNTWNKIAGLPMEEGANVDVYGFYIRDGRRDPPIAICKNCKFDLVTDQELERRGMKREPLDNPPEFFQYAGECVSYIKKMNLSSDDERKMRIVALVEKPAGLNSPVVTHMFMDKDAIKER